MTRQLAMPTATEPPAPVVDQVTAAYLARAGSATACVHQLFDDAWTAAGGVHERRRLVALRDGVLRVVAEAERDADVAHGLGLGDEEGAHG